LAVPYAGHAELIRGLRGELAGKTVISCVNPVGFDASGAFAIQPGAGSAAEEAAQLAPEARVVAAYHHLSAPKLLRPEADVSGDDVLLCGDDEDALLLVDELTRRGLGARPVRAGALRLAGTLEALTAVIISVNRRYRVSAGVALTGFPRPDPAEAEHAARPS
ncbi:NADPH-dependent F420 reductase, partial [Leucobacter sp. M11]|uniref:NADPH-dependent F420 reductase n=1 Tax=Leucobacter sp. M11 TaxID=2993565 RepID=UPI002D7F7DA7